MKPDDLAQVRARLNAVLYAERVTRILCRRSGDVPGYEWRAPERPYSMISTRKTYKIKGTSHRTPPLPFHAFVHKGAGFCRVCGQPIYGEGSFRSFAGPTSRRTWHNVCVTTYDLMVKPNNYAAPLILLQGQRCGLSGAPIALPYPSTVEVDHDVPLYRVAREHAAEPWYELVRFWMTGNLKAVTRAAHVAKCAEEAKDRARNKTHLIEQGALL